MRAKPFRRKDRKSGREIGSYYGKPRKGDAVSLQTRNPQLALERLRLLRQGRWKPIPGGKRVTELEDNEEDSGGVAASGVDTALSGDPSKRHESDGETPGATTPPETTTPHPAPVGEPARPAVLMPEVLRPRADGWADDATAAAGDAPSSGESPPGGPEPPGPETDQILQMAAEGWVSGCKTLGRWIARRRGLRPNEIPTSPATDLLENMTVTCTKQVLLTLLPQIGDVGPEWGMIGGGLAIACMQFLGAEAAPPGSSDDGKRP